MTTPFLKWAGGKRYLAEELLARMPKRIATYYEPMVGAGAIFMALADRKRFDAAWINDINSELVNAYTIIKTDVGTLIKKIKYVKEQYLAAKNRSTYYYKVRDLQTGLLSPAGAAARTIFLNKTCFNGLYRVNKSGKFNVPYGDFKNPSIFDETNLIALSKILKNVRVTCDDFVNVIFKAKPGDVVYFDPPYWPVKEGSFTSYTDNGFTSKDQVRLATVAKKLRDDGILTIISNSDTPAVRKLYKGFIIDQVQVPRQINCNVSARGKVNELIIMTHQI